MKLNGRMILFTAILVIITTACKFFFGPSLAWSGFSPVIAIALFSGFMIRDRNMSFLLPLFALFLSDLFIQLLYVQGSFPYEGLYSGQWKNYLVLLSTTLLGWALKGRSYSSLAIGGLAAPTIFFLVSNFLVWNGINTTYTKDFNGLMTCYEAGLPFYRNALISTLLFLPLILVAYNYISREKLALKLA